MWAEAYEASEFALNCKMLYDVRHELRCNVLLTAGFLGSPRRKKPNKAMLDRAHEMAKQLARDGTQSHVHPAAVNVARWSQDWDLARQLLKGGQEAAPDHVQYHVSLAELERDAGENERALKAARAALKRLAKITEENQANAATMMLCQGHPLAAVACTSYYLPPSNVTAMKQIESDALRALRQLTGAETRP